MIKVKEKAYRIQGIGSGGVKVKLPNNWAAAQGWERGDMVYICYNGDAMVVTKKRKKNVITIGKYKIAQDGTLYIPCSLRDELGLKKGALINVYTENSDLYYYLVKKGDKGGK